MAEHGHFIKHAQSEAWVDKHPTNNDWMPISFLFFNNLQITPGTLSRKNKFLSLALRKTDPELGVNKAEELKTVSSMISNEISIMDGIKLLK